jgi:hypothetical protein
MLPVANMSSDPAVDAARHQLQQEELVGFGGRARVHRDVHIATAHAGSEGEVLEHGHVVAAGRRRREGNGGDDAYRADALLAMARAGREGTMCSSSGPRHTVHVVIDHAALLRGKAQADERCEVAGVGRVPVKVVRSMLDDAFVSAVVSDGVDVSTVAHLGRRPTAHQRSALEVRDPECVVAGCHVRVGLEIDHVEPWSATRITRLDALARLCRFHHAQKTHEGYRLEGGPGHWRWLKPDGTEVTPRPRPARARPPDDDTGTIAERQARICDAAIKRIEEYVATKRVGADGR